MRSFLSIIVLQLIIIIQTHHHHSFYFILQIFGTRDLLNISYSRVLYLFSKFLHFEEIVRVKMAVCFEMIVSAVIQKYVIVCRFSFES